MAEFIGWALGVLPSAESKSPARHSLPKLHSVFLYCSAYYARYGSSMWGSGHTIVLIQAQQKGGDGGLCSKCVVTAQNLQLYFQQQHSHPEAQH